MIKEPLGTREAAQIAGRCQRTIVAWIKAGKLPAWKHSGNKGPYVIDKADLMTTIRELSKVHPYQPKDKDDQ